MNNTNEANNQKSNNIQSENILTREFFKDIIDQCKKEKICIIPFSKDNPIIEIGSKAFYDWESCEYIIIPPTVKKISADAFKWENIKLIITNLDLSYISAKITIFPYQNAEKNNILLDIFKKINDIDKKIDIDSNQIEAKRDRINREILDTLNQISNKEKALCSETEKIEEFVKILQAKLDEGNSLSKEVLETIEKVISEKKGEIDLAIEEAQKSLIESQEMTEKSIEEKYEELRKKCDELIQTGIRKAIEKNQQIDKETTELIDSTRKKLSSMADEIVNGTLEKIREESPYKNITVIINNIKKTSGKPKLVHKKFEEVVKLISLGFHPLLVGPAGCGKNVIIEQAAETLELPFYYINNVTEEHKIMGFVDANGNYKPTQFYKAFTEGGLIMIDELDSSNPSVLLAINSAIGTGYHQYCAFPDGKFYERNEKFYLVAAANTYGTGADMIYCGRNTLDGASINRFIPVYIDYDTELEKQLVKNKKILELYWQIRKIIQKNKIRHVISTRNIVNGDTMIESGLFDNASIFNMTIVQGMSDDDLRIILNDLNSNSSDNFIIDFINFLSNQRGIDKNEYMQKTKSIGYSGYGDHYDF